MDEFDDARAQGVHVPHPEQPPRVIVGCVHTSDYKPLADITVPTIYNYCMKHGYDLYYNSQWEIDHPEQANEGDRIKVNVYKDIYADNVLTNRYDVFMWIDADALIMNSAITIEDVLRRSGVDDSVHFLWAHDEGGPNSGVYFARFTPKAHRFMHTQQCRSIEMGWGDNTAMIQTMVVAPFSSYVKCVPGRLFNAYLAPLYNWTLYAEEDDSNAYHAGDFILHLPGLPQADRIKIAAEMAAKAT